MFYNYKMETEGLAPKTIVNINLFLHKTLSFAVGEGYLKTNPAESLNLSRGQKPQIEILNRDEQAALIRGSYGHRYGVFVRLTLFTGPASGRTAWTALGRRRCAEQHDQSAAHSRTAE